VARVQTASESEALKNCGVLLRFATENIKDVPQATVATISAALDADQANAWDQKVATEFWLAYNSLCSLIKPATVDTITANLREIPSPKWAFWRKAQPLPLSKRIASRYIVVLMSLLCIAVALGFLVSSVTRLNTEIEKLIGSGNELAEKIVTEVDGLVPILGDKQFSAAAANEQKTISLIQNQLQELYYAIDQMLPKNQAMVSLMSFGLSKYNYEPGDLKPVEKLPDVRESVRVYYLTRRDVVTYQLNSSISLGVIGSSILPIILGLMCACAYVVRLISDQIKESTFSTTSPIRHLVRVALGGLAGVAIGFGGVANGVSLSPSALAFIAGYAVEPVFATFDSIADKFRRG